MSTPGPWHTGYLGLKEYRKEVIFDEKSGFIAEVLEKENTSLIAAAPDLLASLKDVLAINFANDNPMIKAILSSAKRAVDKAEGGSK